MTVGSCELLQGLGRGGEDWSWGGVRWVCVCVRDMFTLLYRRRVLSGLNQHDSPLVSVAQHFFWVTGPRTDGLM